MTVYEFIGEGYIPSQALEAKILTVVRGIFQGRVSFGCRKKYTQQGDISFCWGLILK